MDILTTPLSNEIAAISNAPQYPVQHTWDCIIHTGKEDIKAQYVDGYNCIRNYTTDFCEEISVDVMLGQGDLLHAIFPNRQVLEVTLTKTPLAVGSDFVKSTLPQTVTRYKAQLYDGSNSAVEGNIPGAEDRQKLNQMFIKPVKIQLINPVVDYLRKTTVGGVLGEGTGADCIRAMLGKYTREFIAKKGGSLTGVDVAPGSNTTIRENIIIPEHTPVINIPAIVDMENGGIYPAGFWYHLQNNMWYVYPTMDTKLYDKSDRTLNVINVPSGRFPDSEKTFRITGTQVIVLATGDTQHVDLSERDQLQKGNAVRYIDPVNLFHNYFTSEGNKAIANRDKVMTEIVSEPRKDGSNLTTLSDNPITSRHYKEFSKLAYRSGVLIQAVWENGDIDRLYPGMPVKYSYLSTSNVLKESKGILAGVQCRDKATSNNTVERKFKSVIALTLFVNRDLDGDV